jgi:predicted O-methyltransferase YrrM
MLKVGKFILRYFLTLAIIIVTYTLGLFIKKYRKFIWLISLNSNVSKLLNDTENQITFGIPIIDPINFISSFQEKILYPIGFDGNVTTLELLLLIYYIKLENPLKVFEIGTFNGRTTINFAINTSNDTVIYTLDLEPNKINDVKFNLEEIEKKYIIKNEVKILISDSIANKKIIQLYGDSAKFDFSSYYGLMEFIFVDGSHHYDYVINDTKVALKLVNKKRGIIFWHDYNHFWPGVVKALNEFYNNNSDFKMYHLNGTSLVYLQFCD